MDERDHKTGFQVFAEVGLHEPLFIVDAVYIDASRIGPSSSNMFMIGLGIEAGFENFAESLRTKNADSLHEEELTNPTVPSAGLIINNSVFTNLSPRVVVGLEILSYFDVMSNGTFIVFYPQIHVTITTTLTVQLGLGFLFDVKGLAPRFAYRVINESPVLTD